MNIFVVDTNPVNAARDLCDKHVVKMILESAQMLSTAHRVLDGNFYYREGKNGRKIPSYVHPNPVLNERLLLATMMNHPCTRWAMETTDNYYWLFGHGLELCSEYTKRYNKIHGLQRLYDNFLFSLPMSIKYGKLTPFAQAMPDQYKCSDAVQAYRNYYLNEKSRFAKWKNSQVPEWYLDMTANSAILAT